MTITVIAVHGNGGGGFRFSLALDHIPEGVDLCPVTLPGFAARPADPEIQSLADYADALAAMVERASSPRVLLGHGIGGSIALEVVRRHPGLVDGLILDAPIGPRLDERAFPRLLRPRWVREVVRRGIASRVTRPLTRRLLLSDAVARPTVDTFLDEYGRCSVFGDMFDLITADWWNGLPELRLPSAILWGASDRVVRSGYAPDVTRVLPDATVSIQEGWGHFPMLETPADWAARIAAVATALVDHGATAPPPAVLGHLTIGLAPKAARLDEASEAGLPVPHGVVITDAARRAAHSVGLIDSEGVADDPARLVAFLAVPPLGRVAVRSAMDIEDDERTALAGAFRTVLDVDSGDPEALGRAISEVWASGPEVDHRDVIVQTLVDAMESGVAFTERGHSSDLVNVTAGLGDRLVGGLDPGTREVLPRHAPPASGRPHRLHGLLEHVRSVFGDEDWDIEWADDGSTCFLLQIRPITGRPVRNEWLTRANHKEILPDLPSTLMTGAIERSGTSLFDWYRRFDPSFPGGRPFIVVIGGRPLINLSLLVDFMAHLGLPSSLVTDSLGGDAVEHVASRPARLVRKLPVLARLGWAQAGAVGDTRRAAVRILEDTSDLSGGFGETIAALERSFVSLVHAMMSAATRMSTPMAILRKTGALAEHAGRHRSATAAIWDDLEPLRAILEAHPDEASKARSGELPEIGEFADAWAGYLSKHGHRAIYESDVARPRFREDPAPLLAAASTPRTSSPRRPRRTFRGVVTAPLWWFARRALAARETLRNEAMIGFDRIRRRLLHLGAEAVADGRLNSLDDLWLLTPDEASRLDDGWRVPAALVDDRRQDRAALEAIDMPDLLRRFDDLATVRTADADTPLRGLPLTGSERRGRAWVASEPGQPLPDGFEPDGTILVAPAVDAGWVPTFALVSGVVVETGGDLSHGSIVLREIGLPSVTNVAGAMDRLSTGDVIAIRSNGSVDVLEPSRVS